jgi:hypothetical protein
MSLKLRPELGPGESPTGSGAGASKPATTATTAPHSQLTGAGECSPPPSSAAPRYIDDKDIRVLNNLLDDLKKLDTYCDQEKLELATTGRRDSAAGEGLHQSGHGDVLLEPKDGPAEQVTYKALYIGAALQTHTVLLGD